MDIVYHTFGAVALLCILVICLLVFVFGVRVQWDMSCVVPLSFGGGVFLRLCMRRVLWWCFGTWTRVLRVPVWCGFRRVLRVFRLCMCSSYLLGVLYYYTTLWGWLHFASILVICLLVWLDGCCLLMWVVCGCLKQVVSVCLVSEWCWDLMVCWTAQRQVLHWRWWSVEYRT